MKIRHFALFMIIIVISACTWIEPTKESLEVILVKPGNVLVTVKNWAQLTSLSLTKLEF